MISLREMKSICKWRCITVQPRHGKRLAPDTGLTQLRLRLSPIRFFRPAPNRVLVRLPQSGGRFLLSRQLRLRLFLFQFAVPWARAQIFSKFRIRLRQIFLSFPGAVLHLRLNSLSQTDFSKEGWGTVRRNRKTFYIILQPENLLAVPMRLERARENIFGLRLHQMHISLRLRQSE